MDVTVHIPDDLVCRMTEAGGDLSRRALEEYKGGRISSPEFRHLLGFGARYELDGFLKAHGVYEDYTMEDLEREREDLRRLGY